MRTRWQPYRSNRLRSRARMSVACSSSAACSPVPRTTATAPALECVVRCRCSVEDGRQAEERAGRHRRRRRGHQGTGVREDDGVVVDEDDAATLVGQAGGLPGDRVGPGSPGSRRRTGPRRRLRAGAWRERRTLGWRRRRRGPTGSAGRSGHTGPGRTRSGPCRRASSRSSGRGWAVPRSESAVAYVSLARRGGPGLTRDPAGPAWPRRERDASALAGATQATG